MFLGGLGPPPKNIDIISIINISSVLKHALVPTGEMLIILGLLTPELLKLPAF